MNEPSTKKEQFSIFAFLRFAKTDFGSKENATRTQKSAIREIIKHYFILISLPP
jgi:hypothetical protein